MKEKNFKFKKSFGALVGKMTNRQAGEFIKAVCGYVFDGKPMESKDEYLKGVFLYVQSVLDTAEQNKANGKIGGAIVAEKYKELRARFATEEATISETNVVTQLVIVAADDNAQTDKGKPYKKNRRPKNFNAYGGGKCPNENKDDHRKAV